MFLVVEDTLIEVRDAPAERDVIDKEFGEFGSIQIKMEQDLLHMLQDVLKMKY